MLSISRWIAVLFLVCPVELFAFQQMLPDFSLKDPANKTFTKKDVLAEGAVFVVTAPIMRNQKAQEGWEKYLSGKKSGKGKLILLEDMSPSMFKKTALKRMKEEYEPGKEPILLIDPKGQLREKLGVKKKETVVLVYNKDGKLVFNTTEKPSAKGADKIWGSIK
ncbi:MAG: hypothetical protein Q7T03_00355 [Deltaproteobacteria bacterium]|nr:hypothetical protein [Deltaproteobacteria bacterium]